MEDGCGERARSGRKLGATVAAGLQGSSDHPFSFIRDSEHNFAAGTWRCSVLGCYADAGRTHLFFLSQRLIPVSCLLLLTGCLSVHQRRARDTWPRCAVTVDDSERKHRLGGRPGVALLLSKLFAFAGKETRTSKRVVAAVLQKRGEVSR